MSKIPRSFVTPTPNSKLPILNATPGPISVNIPKFITPKQTPPDIKSGPLLELNTDVFHKESIERSTKGKSAIKRTAPPTNLNPPQKQMKIASKTCNPAAKIAPYDYKARFNDLLDKHKIMKSEFSDLQEKLKESNDEQLTANVSLENIIVKNSVLSRQLENLTTNHENLKSKYDCLNNDYVTEKKISLDLSNETEGLQREITELKKSLSDTTTDLHIANAKFSNKLIEYDSLKQLYEKEVEKCSKLSSLCEEANITLLNYRNDVEQEKLEYAKKIDNLTDELKNVQKNLEDKNVESDKYKKVYNLETQKCNEMSINIKNQSEEIIKYSNDLLRLNKCKELLEMKNANDLSEIQSLTQKNIELQNRIELMHDNQKSLRNEIQDLKGHIRVFCRIRPALSGESSKVLLNVDVIDSSTMEIDKSLINSISGAVKKQRHSFTFDGVFPPNSPQVDVFNEVSGLIQSALDGYNVCIFAYGQTGSGKTYTMEGISNQDSMGIIPRAIEMIFSSLPNLKKMGWDFTIHASFLEIYNENIYDLLNSNKDQEEHCIKMTDSKGSDVYVTNLKEETVSNSAELFKLLGISQRNRQTAATMCNERSSRSHSVTKIRVSASHEQRKEKYTSNLNLVDLAGSESGKTSQRMDETKSINKSLSELSKVILALQSKQSHIPYRNSKLTYLLMPSLGGNSKTLMLVNVAQFEDCYQESMNSLRFAAQVNSCRNGVIKKNISTT